VDIDITAASQGCTGRPDQHLQNDDSMTKTESWVGPIFNIMFTIKKVLLGEKGEKERQELLPTRPAAVSEWNSSYSRSFRTKKIEPLVLS